MMNFLTVMAAIGQIAVAPNAFASKPCDSPKPIFGKVLATCDDQMVTYVGDKKLEILGVNVTTSEFELAYCKNGEGRKPLTFQTGSEGYYFNSQIYYHPKHQTSYQISRVWGTFRMQGTDIDGNPVDVRCREYNDTRTDIKYLYN